jgi:exoribonuclease-2
VPVAANLRHDQLDHIVTEELAETLKQGHTPNCPGLRGAILFAAPGQAPEGQARVVRGKPENFNRPDYNFRLVGNDGAEPNGSETVQISVRKRGAPLDLIVAEAAIVANSTWGLMLAEHGVPGIYRSQASLAPGVKVRMGTKACRTPASA